MSEDLSRRAVFATSAGALVAGLPLSSMAAPAPSRVAARFAAYEFAKAEYDAAATASAARYDQFVALLPEVPADIVQPNQIFRSARNGWEHAAAQPFKVLDKNISSEVPTPARYRSEALKDLIAASACPSAVLQEAKRLLPIVEAYEAAERRATEASGLGSMRSRLRFFRCWPMRISIFISDICTVRSKALLSLSTLGSFAPLLASCSAMHVIERCRM